MKIKCFKATCPQCKSTGSIQLFMNKSLEVRYARTRHYTHLDTQSKKPQFTYCKITDLQTLKTLLLNKSISLSTTNTVSGHLGQGNIDPYVDHKLKDPSSNSKNGWAGSSVRTEHHPPKVGVVGSNPTPPVLDKPQSVLKIQVGYLHLLKSLHLL